MVNSNVREPALQSIKRTIMKLVVIYLLIGNYVYFDYNLTYTGDFEKFHSIKQFSLN